MGISCLPLSDVHSQSPPSLPVSQVPANGFISYLFFLLKNVICSKGNSLEGHGKLLKAVIFGQWDYGSFLSPLGFFFFPHCVYTDFSPPAVKPTKDIFFKR